jgi:hypothetical protein
MAELVHEYFKRVLVQNLNDPERLVNIQRADLEAMRQEELLTHPGWEWYRRQVADKALLVERALAALVDKIAYGNELGDALTELKMRARGLQAEAHTYKIVLALIREAAQKELTLPEVGL